MDLFRYTQEFRKSFTTLFSTEDISKTELFQKNLSNLIVDFFHKLSENQDPVTQSSIILNALFLSFTERYAPTFPFQLDEFITTCSLTDKERKQFLIALLNGIYYGDFHFFNHQTQNSCDQLQFYLLQILAENISKRKLVKVLSALDPLKKTFLLCYIFRHQREGTFYILEAFKNKKEKTILRALAQHLSRQQYDVNKLHAIFMEPYTQKKLEDIIQELEADKEEQTLTFFTAFNSLLPLMIESPLAIYQAIEQVKKPKESTGYEKAVSQRNYLKERFQSYYQQNYTLADFKKFVQVFGLSDILPFFSFFGQEFQVSSLVQKVILLKEVFANPLSMARLPSEELLSFYSFVFIFISHLEALCRNPQKYIEGLHILACGIPTYGKKISTLPCVTSILESLQFFIDSIGLKIALKDFPIYIFDQSEEKIFKENQIYLEKLNKKMKGTVFHLSKETIFSLGKKIGILNLLDTDKKGSLGFGGARNAVFLLTPLLHQNFQCNQTSPEDLLKQSDAKIQSSFREILNPSTTTLLMLDDDIKIAEASLLSYSLLASENRHDYYFSMGFSFGRNTKILVRFVPLKHVLTEPQLLYSSNALSPLPHGAIMSEYIGKPKICLNLPFGREESHIGIKYISNLISKPSFHFSGTRYPNKEIPTHVFIGLEEYLQSYLPYTVEIQMCHDLLGGETTSVEKSPLFWNENKVYKNWKCLQDVLEFIAKDSTKEEMQSRFWSNMRSQFIKREESYSLHSILQELIQMDVKGVLKEFETGWLLTKKEKTSLKKIGKIYLDLQKDAKLFWEFGDLLLKIIPESFEGCSFLDAITHSKNELEKKYHLKLSDYRLPYGLYLLACSVGAGEFNTSVITRVT